MSEIVRRFYGVVQPLKEMAEWEQSLVEGQHDLWICVFGSWGDLPDALPSAAFP